MRAYVELTKAQLRLFARNRQMLFFSLFFPILMMVGLGSFLDGGDVSVSGYVVDEDGSEASGRMVETLLGVEALGMSTGESRESALAALREGDTQLVVVLPAGYGEKLTAGVGAVDEGVKVVRLTLGEAVRTPSGSAETPAATTDASTGMGAGASAAGDAAAVAASADGAAQVDVFYDEQNMTVSQLGVQYVSGVVDGVSKEITGYAPAVRVAASPVESLGLRYIDFLVPGILAMMIMSTNLNGVAGQISSWRERGVLRRMQSTTLKARTFIAAQITARLLLNGSQAVIVLLIASLVFGTRVSGSWLLLLFYVVLGTLVFMSIGFIIAGTAKTPESAGPIAGLISFPLLFLGNVFFPVRNMPEFLQPIVQALPIVHLSDAMRDVMNVGAGIGSLWGETLILGGWLVAAFAIASWTFRWE
ncbi:ABC transporter permease [Paenibacillus sp. TRM 82003]|nr:ABC transporter permease [Paenibacillus sp. TRM 82003]